MPIPHCASTVCDAYRAARALWIEVASERYESKQLLGGRHCGDPCLITRCSIGPVGCHAKAWRYCGRQAEPVTWVEQPARNSSLGMTYDERCFKQCRPDAPAPKCHCLRLRRSALHASSKHVDSGHRWCMPDEAPCHHLRRPHRCAWSRPAVSVGTASADHGGCESFIC